MGLFSWFSKTQEPKDYEEVLAQLQHDVRQRQTRLSELRLRERRATLLTTLYALAAWGAYLSVWYVYPALLPGREDQFTRALRAIPVVVGPILILLTRRIVQIWYKRIGDNEEKALKTALTKQRTKVEEIKKATNYYTTRSLLERYDDAAPFVIGSPVQGQMTPQVARQHGPRQSMPPQNGGVPATPQRGAPPPIAVQSPMNPALQSQLSPQPMSALPPPRKQWYDKLADAVLGDDSSGSAERERYALICQQCFAHNGLVPKEQWGEVKYKCPKCGYFNGPARRNLSPASGPARGREEQQHKMEPMTPAMPKSATASIHGTGPATPMEVDQ